VPVVAISELDFAAFQSLAYDAAGISLPANKREMLVTRLARRLQALGLPGYRAYYQLLMSGDPTGDEREHFINCITTNKTDFFREPHHFDFLREHLIPELRARVASGAPRRLRIWSAACSTGEEPYSIAMVAHRELARDGYEIEIVASDIDTAVLARAHDGHYANARIAEIPPEHRLRYLERTGDDWRIRDELRSIVQFHQINLIHDRFPFQGAFDAIFIRNVIIYFDRPSQGALFRRLRSYLADTSYLFLGHSESLLHISDAFMTAGRTTYRPRAARRRATTIKRIATQAIKLPPSGSLASEHTVRIDVVVGPGVSACMFDPAAKVGGMVELQAGGDDEPGRSLEQLIAQLVAQGASRGALRAKLVGGGAATPDDRDLAARSVDLAEAFLQRAGIPVAAKRVGGPSRLEVQFFTDSGRLLLRTYEPVTSGGLT